MDAELRADGLGASKGILVVEGPDDKRVFARHVQDLSQILPAGGRRMLISAHEKANPQQRTKILFVTDCDYEVRRGALRGFPDLVITTLTDMESDLLDLGLIELLVLELVPQALESQAVCQSISAKLRGKAEKMALPIGRLRMAAQPLGIPLDWGDVKIARYWDPRTESVDFAKFIDAMHSKVSDEVSFIEWRKLATETPEDVSMCHGKDLVRILASLLKSEYRVENITADGLARMMRANLTRDYLDSWGVVRRIKTWQVGNQRQILRP